MHRWVRHCLIALVIGMLLLPLPTANFVQWLGNRVVVALDVVGDHLPKGSTR